MGGDDRQILDEAQCVLLQREIQKQLLVITGHLCKKKNVVKLCAHRIKLFQLGGWIISYGHYLMMFHSRVSDCKAHVCGQCLINGRQLHDIMRKGSYLLAIVKTER